MSLTVQLPPKAANRWDVGMFSVTWALIGTIRSFQPLPFVGLAGRKEAIMVPIVWIGALLVICGVLFMARTAILRGKMSNPHAGATLEPDRRSLRFLGVSANWPGIVLIAVGGWMLLWGAL